MIIKHFHFFQQWILQSPYFPYECHGYSARLSSQINFLVIDIDKPKNLKRIYNRLDEDSEALLKGLLEINPKDRLTASEA